MMPQPGQPVRMRSDGLRCSERDGSVRACLVGGSPLRPALRNIPIRSDCFGCLCRRDFINGLLEGRAPGDRATARTNPGTIRDLTLGTALACLDLTAPEGGIPDNPVPGSIPVRSC